MTPSTSAITQQDRPSERRTYIRPLPKIPVNLISQHPFEPFSAYSDSVLLRASHEMLFPACCFFLSILAQLVVGQNATSPYALNDLLSTLPNISNFTSYLESLPDLLSVLSDGNATSDCCRPHPTHLSSR